MAPATSDIRLDFPLEIWLPLKPPTDRSKTIRMTMDRAVHFLDAPGFRDV